MARVLHAAETLIALTLAWVLVFVLPFRLLSRILSRGGDAVRPTPPAARERARAATRRVQRWAPRFPLGKTTCLVRAVAGWLLLARRGIAAHIRFGVRKEQGVVQAHAWLMVGEETLLGGAQAEGFQPIADLGGGSRAPRRAPDR